MAKFDWRNDSTVWWAASLNWPSASLICYAPVAWACIPSVTVSKRDLFREFVHTHHTGGDRRLHLLDHLLDVISGDGRLVGQSSPSDSTPSAVNSQIRLSAARNSRTRPGVSLAAGVQRGEKGDEPRTNPDVPASRSGAVLCG